MALCTRPQGKYRSDDLFDVEYYEPKKPLTIGTLRKRKSPRVAPLAVFYDPDKRRSYNLAKSPRLSVS
ncbi:hypothetical protein Ciccas_000377 [Cichlidogyrus casuarinus]|uniref:Uncharacterized protein n=1 Tax=Cichlidogyrus casuarinus TaxID=1844966 RepID=A0ABD2QR19_9PLAT